MIRIARIILIAVITLGWANLVQAQGKNESAIGETMRSNGRIYVVIAVILTILIGLIIYLVRLDRKIGKLEQQKF